MRFTSRPIDEHDDAPLADGGRAELTTAGFAPHRRPAPARGAAGSACYVVSVCLAGEADDAERKLAEIVGLVHARGDRVVGEQQHRASGADARTYLGRGAAEAIAARAVAAGADMLVIDAELSPSQTRNLEDLAGLPICDREAVILAVFLRSARTRAARIQVEVAQLEYLRPRIRGLGLEMDQQVGGSGPARGPGETASELRARQLDGRLAELRKGLARLRTAGRTQRRGRSGCERICLVGYTNAGKTSLMNALTHAGLSARDRPFETLDTTSRCLSRKGGDVVLSDTVGFIRRLPERLLASFESTLAEVREATLLLLVVDVSDPEWPLHLETTSALLERLDANHVRRHYAFNKRDRVAEVDEAELARRSEGHPFTALSARDPHAVAALRESLIARVRAQRRVARVFVPYDAPALMERVHRNADVLAVDARPHGVRMTLEAEPALVDRIRAAGQRVPS